MAGSRALVKTGRLAERAGIFPSKVRFYVQEGLLQPDDQTPGGYFLFDESEALDRLRFIDKLKAEQRLTLSEIKAKLASLDGENADDRRATGS